MDRTALASLGCKTNQYEIDALAEWFRQRGFHVVDDKERADIYVLNTCTVTAEAERKARQLFRRYRKLNEDAIIVACGCYSERSNLSDLVDVCVGTFGRSEIPALIYRALIEKDDEKASLFIEKVNACEKNMRDCENLCLAPVFKVNPAVDGKIESTDKSYEELMAPAIPDETRAFLKVQDGCDNRCAYCAISIARGPARSRKLEHIIEEARVLAEQGFSEFVLTGTNLNLYGIDFCRSTACEGDTHDLADVIVALSRVNGVKRIRLGSLESSLITDDFIAKIKDIESLCPSFHLSLQSGSDRILRAMRRRDSKDTYRDAVAKIRDAFPHAGITTDLIVGFPGETQEDFDETLAFCDEIGFLRIHVFRFSRRPGTLADKMPQQVPADIAIERSEILRAKATELAVKAIEDRMGQVFEVLIEQFDDQGRAEGYTPDYIFVKGVMREVSDVVQTRDRSLPARGSIVPMKIIGIEDEMALAEMIYFHWS